MDALEQVIARDEIRQLAYRYALAMDSRNIDDLVGLFVEDVQVGAHATGREALRENFERQLREVGVTILFVGNHVIDFDEEDAARGQVYCRAEVEEGDHWIQQAILYSDRYRRYDGHWYFVRRQHRLWYGAQTATNPLRQDPAHWPASQTGRGSLPGEWETWTNFWGKTK